MKPTEFSRDNEREMGLGLYLQASCSLVVSQTDFEHKYKLFVFFFAKKSL